jgi:hypothetical protein
MTMATKRISAAQTKALAELPCEFGATGSPHPNILRALVRRGLAVFDWSANDGYNGNPPEVRRYRS